MALLLLLFVVTAVLYLVGAVQLKNGPKRRAYQPQGVPGYAYSPGDAPSGGYAVLGFFIPLIGLILYLTQRDQTPLRAKSAGKGALTGVIVWVGLSIIATVILVILMLNDPGYY